MSPEPTGVHGLLKQRKLFTHKLLNLKAFIIFRKPLTILTAVSGDFSSKAMQSVWSAMSSSANGRVITLYSIIGIPFLQFIKEFVAVPTFARSNVPIAFHYHFSYLPLVFIYFFPIIQNLLCWTHTTHLFLHMYLQYTQKHFLIQGTNLLNFCRWFPDSKKNTFSALPTPLAQNFRKGGAY